MDSPIRRIATPLAKGLIDTHMEMRSNCILGTSF
jgi:hypothetical protein